ncbi:glycosyltransferase [Vibrio atypicus]|uniref:glycosyltransferase n=1 Tax=Vibrio atypicus TaxID=558271 RepID=UPI00135858CE|nr:glycosyltransferase [Vibrio atypicus]
MTNKLKCIVHVVQHLAPGGLESLALNMLAFSEPEQRVLIVSLEGTKLESIANWPKLAQYQDQLIFLNKPAGCSLKTLMQLYKLFNVLQPHTVHTHHIGPMLYGAVAARLAGVSNRIHTEHDAWHLNSRKHRSLQKVALNVASPHLVADATLVGDQISRHFNYKNITVIKNGVDCQQFKPGSKFLARQTHKLPTNVTLIGTAGRLEKVKGQDVLINAMPLLNSDIHLVIAGCGNERTRLERQARALGVSHRVTFLGLVDDMPRFYQSLDLFCLPSRSEGFPLSTLEAQACGIVTIATNVGASGETLDPDSGLLVNSENHQELASAIQQALKDSDSANPRSFVLNQHDIRQMIVAYNSLTKEKSA